MENLNADQIVAIIQAGHDAKVAMLEVGPLKITYQDAEKPISQVQYTPLQHSEAPNEPLKRTPQTEMDNLQLHLTDPELFEKIQLLGDLPDEET